MALDFNVKQINITNQNLIENENPRTISDFLIILVLFGIISLVINGNPNNKRINKLSVLSHILIALLLMLVLPILSICLLLFLIYRSLVTCYLFSKHKDKFKGLLNGPDALWTLEDASNSNSIINILLIVHNKDNNTFKKTVEQKFDALLKDETLWKLRCSVCKELGYSYLLESEHIFTTNVCKELDGAFYAHREMLQETLSCFASVGIQQNVLWEVYIGKTQISWGQNRHCYPLIVRFHHCLGDGFALLQLMEKCFAPTQQFNTVFEADDNDFMQAMIKVTIRLMHVVAVFNNMPKTICNLLKKRPDNNSLHLLNKKLSGEKLLAWKVENGYRYVNRLMAIKRRLIGSGFFDILASAIGYSLEKTLKDKNLGTVHAVIPAMPHFQNHNLGQEQNGGLTNRFSVGLLDLPISLNEFKEKSNEKTWKLTRRCVLNVRNLFELKNSYEFQFNYWLMHIIMALLPQPIMAAILQPSLSLSTLVISNLPGPRRMYFNMNNGERDKESALEDIVFWVPHRGLTGVGISIFTYEGRFQLGISLDKVYGLSSKEAENILERIFDYIDFLYDELE